MSESPLELVRRLSLEKRSGEFICAASWIEIHVYLQRGRIAWAIDSQHPLAFARHLQESTNIDAETLKQVVDECRREKLPLGETLVEWGLASWSAVRSSLRHQVVEAMRLLSGLGDARTLFLERGYDRYNERLTFELIELLEGDRDAGAQLPATRIAGELHAAIDGVIAVELLEDEELVEGAPADEPQRTPPELVRESVLDGADFVAVRAGVGSVVGARLGERRSLWCFLEASSTFGSAVSALWAVVAPGNPIEAPPLLATNPRRFAGGAGSPGAERVGEFLDRAPEILAVLIENAGAPILGIAAEPVIPDALVDTASRRKRCLETSLASLGAGPKTSATMALGEGTLWLFAGGIGPDLRVWLALDRQSSQGLGWAYLSALARGLEGLSEEIAA